MPELLMTCASCRAELGRFKRLPKKADWRLCEIKPIPPVLKLIAGSSQICTHCGGYMLLPGGKVLTNQGPLEEVLTRQPEKPPARRRAETKRGGESEDAMDG